MSAEEKPQVTIEMENEKQIVLELYPENAPNTVDNFIYLIEDGFYDGLTFHRVIEGFMIQGGDPEGTGTGGPGYSIKGEFESNGFDNDISHTRGVISMARSQHPDSAGSQFFIMHQDASHLDGDYAAFGKVIEGMEVVDEIASVNTDSQDRPEEPQIMKKMTVETFGKEFAKPEKIK
ncbi:MAG: peptidylprolyl isomerase [Halanaerobiaceae bacterium]